MGYNVCFIYYISLQKYDQFVKIRHHVLILYCDNVVKRVILSSKRGSTYNSSTLQHNVFNKSDETSLAFFFVWQNMYCVCVCINEAVTLLNRDVGGIHFCIELGNTMANNHTFFYLTHVSSRIHTIGFFAVLEYHAYYLLTRYDDGVCLRLRLLGPPIKA